MIIHVKFRPDEETASQRLQRIFRMQIELLQYLTDRGVVSPADHLDRLLRLATTPRMDAACAEMLLEAIRAARAQHPAPRSQAVQRIG